MRQGAWFNRVLWAKATVVGTGIKRL